MFQVVFAIAFIKPELFFKGTGTDFHWNRNGIGLLIVKLSGVTRQS